MMANKPIIIDTFANLIDFRRWAKDNEDSFMKSPKGIWYTEPYTLKQISSGFLGQELKNMAPQAAWNLVSNGIQNYEHIHLIDQLESRINQSLAIKDPNPIPKKNDCNTMKLG